MIEWIPSPNWNARAILNPRGIAVHHFGWRDEPGKPRVYFGIQGAINRFSNPEAKVSAHFLVSEGRIVQMVPLIGVAWHAGSANGTRVGIENDPRWSPETYKTSTLLSACILRLSGLPANDETLKPHNAFGNTLCPGECNMGRYIQMTQDAMKLPFADIARLVSEIRMF